MIQIEKVCKYYGKVTALEEVSFSVDKGEICGVLGPNGAGKSTLFKVLCGLIKADKGNFCVTSSQKKPVGAIIERPALYSYLNAYENLKVFAGIQGLSLSEEKLRHMLHRVGLPTDRKDPVGNFSMGMRQRLGIAIALLNEPEALILDEPFSGLDPVGIRALRELIKSFVAEQDLAVLISSHILTELERICDRLVVLNKGRFVAQGSPTDLLYSDGNTLLRITADNIEKARPLLLPYLLTVEGDTALISVTKEEMPLILKSLVMEGVSITAFGPENSMERFFENA